MDFTIDTCNENLFSGSETIDRFIKERSDQISIFCADSPRITALPVNDVNAVTAEKSNNREVGLSMPDLSDLDPDAKLSKCRLVIFLNLFTYLAICFSASHPDW